MQTPSRIILSGLLIILFSCGSINIITSLNTKRITLQSKFVKDSFDIHITLPSGYDNSPELFPLIFYTDANLKSGIKLRTIIDEFNKKRQPVSAVFVGVGHFGNYQVLRRRDFITAFIKDQNDSLISDDKNYGQTENFYLFLKKELIPYIEKKYKVNSNRTLIGHSLGGLFSFYCLFRKERLFTNFVSLSPALWINHENLYAFEKKYRQDSVSLHANLYLCVGGAEKFNYILSGAQKMKTHLEKNPFQDLHFEYHEFAGETHNSEVPLALGIILPKLKLN
jgi:predicted alpha/beta superfamily hydrolase